MLCLHSSLDSGHSGPYLSSKTETQAPLLQVQVSWTLSSEPQVHRSLFLQQRLYECSIIVEYSDGFGSCYLVNIIQMLNKYVSLRLRVQNTVSARPCVGKFRISLVLLNFLHCNFRLWFETP